MNKNSEIKKTLTIDFTTWQRLKQLSAIKNKNMNAIISELVEEEYDLIMIKEVRE